MTVGKSASDFEEEEEKSETPTSSEEKNNSQDNSLGADIVAGLGELKIL